MYGRPVFGSKLETEDWEAVQKIDSSKDRLKALSSVIDKILGNDGQVHSVILTELIKKVAQEGTSDWESVVEDLVKKKRPQDTCPSLAAAECYAVKNEGEKAYQYLSTIKGNSGEFIVTDVPMLYVVKAEADVVLGRKKEAIEDLETALLSDPINAKAYEMLMELVPEKDWLNIRACEMLAAGKTPEEPPDSGTPEHDLYRIYREWYMGSRETATSLLIASRGYREKDPRYCLLSARMSMCEKDWHSAQNMYEAACQSMSGNVAVICETAESYAKDGEYEKALAHYRDAEAYDPESPRVVRGLIDAYMGIGRNAEALQMMKEFLESELSDYDDYVHISESQLRMGYINEAKNSASVILITYPGDGPACVVMSRASVSEGDLRGAQLYAKAGLQRNHKDPEVLAQMSRVCLASRMLNKAIHYGRKSVKYNSNCINGHLALMEAYRETGDNEKTMDVCRAVLELDPQNKEAADTLSKIELEQALRSSTNASNLIPEISGADDFIALISGLLSEKKYAEVIKLCADNDTKFGTLADVRRLRGNAEYAKGDFMKASASFASAAALTPKAEIWHSKGMADEAFGDLESAEGAYDKAVLMNTKEPRYWISKGCVQEKKGDKAGAVESFNHAIELDPRSSYALARKAVILAESARYSEALSFIDLAEATDPDNEGIMKIRMKICLAAGKYTDAVYIGKKLMKKGTPDDVVVCCVVQADIGIGDSASAKKLVEKSLANNPDSERLMAAARDLYVYMGDNDSVIGVCRKLLKTSPYDRKTKRALADALYKTGKGEEATTIYSSLENEDVRGKESERKPAEAGSMQDPESIIGIARSLLSAGDIVGAGRMADRAMAADPDNTDYILFRAAVYRKTGDVRITEAFLSQCILRNPSNGELYESAGDLRAEQGDFEGAVDAYGKAIQNGMKSQTLYVKLGTVQENMGAKDAAMASFRTALMIDPHEAEAGRHLANLQIRDKDYEGASKTIRDSIESQPCAESFAILARIAQGMKDRDGVNAAYANFVRYDDASEEDCKAVITALNSVGLRTEANTLKSRLYPDEMQTEDVPPEVKRNAERIMRRAYMLGAECNDTDVLDSMGIEADAAEKAVRYLEDIPDYGEIIVGTSDFERMEILSHNVIARGKNKDLELITVEAAYVAGGARDADEAKVLLSYMQSCRRSRLPRDIPEKYVKLSENVSPRDDIEQVMLDQNVGVFGARMIMSLVN
ncbi:tetratricopeptide repeat protein [Methanomethylophilus alvi]|uniref:tetratricopeptide repeat protein n=1 Tax=Methanomethylophilus alvi TaxID=1291540 RepID=UPI0037DCAD27